MDEEAQLQATFWQHFSDLRRVLIQIILIIALAAGLIFLNQRLLFTHLLAPFAHNETVERIAIHSFLLKNSSSEALYYTLKENEQLKNQPEQRRVLLLPGQEVPLENKTPAQSLVLLSPIEGLSVLFKACFWIALVGSFPLWSYCLLRFILPALQQNERRFILPFLASLSFSLYLGAILANKLTIPTANAFLSHYNETLGTNLWSLNAYWEYSLYLILANAFAMAASALLFWAIHFGIFSSQTLIDKRRHCIVANFIIAALLTPPDAFTQIALAVPLCAVFEMAILFAKWKEWRQKKALSQSQALEKS